MSKIWSCFLALVFGLIVGAYAHMYMAPMFSDPNYHRLHISVLDPQLQPVEKAQLSFSQIGTLKRVEYGDAIFRWEFDVNGMPGEKIKIKVDDVSDRYLVGAEDLILDRAEDQNVVVKLQPDTSADVFGYIYDRQNKPVAGLEVRATGGSEKLAGLSARTDDRGHFFIAAHVGEYQKVHLYANDKGCRVNSDHMAGTEVMVYCE